MSRPAETKGHGSAMDHLFCLPKTYTCELHLVNTGFSSDGILSGSSVGNSVATSQIPFNPQHV